MGYWEALRRRISEITGRPVAEDDDAIFKYYRGIAPSSGAVLFPGHVFTPATTPPGYEYYTDTNGKVAVKCKHNTSGAMTVTEASASNIDSFTRYMKASIDAMSPTFTARPDNTTVLGNMKRLLGMLKVTLDGGGAGTGTLAAATGSYRGVVKLLGVWGSNAGAETLTIAVTGGTLVGPSVIVVTTVANTVVAISPLASGLVVAGTATTDFNKAITVAVAGALLTQDIYVIYEYWYETP